MSDDEIIAVVQAHKEGKEIEFREHIFPNGVWNNLRNKTTAGWYGWDFQRMDYRVAPEPRKPREWWLGIDNHAYNYEYEALRTGKSIHVRAVIEEDKSTVQRMMEHATGFKND